MSHLILQNLTKRFRQITAVNNLWLEMAQGEIVSVLGPSGCGKSTTLQMVAGILRPDAGTVQLDGRNLNRVAPEKRDIALVLQQGLLFPHLTVGENVAFGLKMRGVNRVDREEAAIAMLRQVQLEGFAHRKPSELSGGQAQRVALARSLVIRPKLLLLDEPLSALDANLRETMQDLILHLQAETGVTLMIVTHDQSEAVVLSDRIAILFDGQLRQVDTPEALYHQPCDEAIARFMGGVNFFPVEAQGNHWRLSNGQRLLSHCPAEGRLQATIRPEQIQVFPEPLCSTNLLSATVLANRFNGMQRRLKLAIATPSDRDQVSDLFLQAWITPNQDFAIGQTVWAHLPPEALWGFPHSASPVLPSSLTPSIEYP